MRRATTAVVLGLAVFLVALDATAQRADFSGKWSPDTQRTLKGMEPNGGVTGGRGSVPGGTTDLTVTQDAESLTIVRPFEKGDGKTVTLYKFNGTVTSGEAVISARWEGSKLLIEEDFHSKSPFVHRLAMYLEGDELVIAEQRYSDDDKTFLKNYYKRAR